MAKHVAAKRMRCLGHGFYIITLVECTLLAISQACEQCYKPRTSLLGICGSSVEAESLLACCVSRRYVDVVSWRSLDSLGETTLESTFTNTISASSSLKP